MTSCELWASSAALLGVTWASSLASEELIHRRSFHSPTLLAVLAPLVTAGAGAWGWLRGHWRRRAPLTAHLLCGALLFTSFWAGAQAQQRLSYAVFTTVKAGRLVVTLGVGALWLNKRYSAADVGAALLAIAGLALTMGLGRHAHSHAAPAAGGAPPAGADAGGAALALLSLLADGVYNNLQEQVLWQHGAAKSELACFSHGTALALMVAAAAADPSTAEGLAAARRSAPTAALLALLAGCGWAGTTVALSVVRTWGTARAAFILTCAKALAVGASLAVQPASSVGASQVAGIAAVFAAVLLSSAAGGGAPPPTPPAAGDDGHAAAGAGGTAAEGPAAEAAAPLPPAPQQEQRQPQLDVNGAGTPREPPHLTTVAPLHGPVAGARLSLPARLSPREALTPASAGSSDSSAGDGGSSDGPPSAEDHPSLAGTGASAAALLRRRRAQSGWPASPQPPASGRGGEQPPAQPTPARLTVASLQGLRRVSSRTLLHLQAASQGALDALSAAGGIQRPAAIYDTLSPAARHRPAVVARAATPSTMRGLASPSTMRGLASPSTLRGLASPAQGSAGGGEASPGGGRGGFHTPHERAAMQGAGASPA